MRRTLLNSLIGATALMASASAASFADEATLMADPTADAFVEALQFGAPRGIRIGTGEGEVEVGAPESTAVAAVDATPSPATTAPPRVNFQVQFAFNSADLTPQAVVVLNQLGEALLRQELAGYRFMLAGHTDAVGSESYNLSLSQQRAAAVRTYLIATFGVGQDRLFQVGLGESDLLDPLNPEADINRRVEITNLGPAA